MDTEKAILTRCLEQIEQLLNWGPAEQWTNHDFENLSARIAEKTQVRLSVSTLKRIWGRVRYDSSPTPVTLNALAQFLDYTGWRDFQAQNTLPAAEVVADAISSQYPTKPVGERRPGWLVYSIAVTLVVLLVLFLVKGKAPERVVAGNIVFKSHKVSDELPNSVVFTYDIGGMPADSVFIQQSWDPERRQRVSPTQHTHTSIYYTPGYFQAKLIVNDSVLKEDLVFIRTKGWRGIIDGKPPVYLTPAEARQPGGMGVSAATLGDKINTSVFTDRWVTFSNVRDFGSLNTDAFTLEVSLRNTATVEQSLCRRVKIIILGKGGAMIIPLAAKGCISDIGVLTSERWIDGKINDLSAFGCNFSTLEHVRCEVANRHLRIFVNDVQALNEPLRLPPLDIIGIRISFEGTGEIQKFKLSGPDTVWLDDNFVQGPI